MKGTLLLVLGRVDESIACYDQALERDARMAAAWFNKGGTLAAKKCHREALACFDRAIEIEPKDSQNWYFKGMSLTEAGKIPEALACFERARQLGHPEAERLSENRGKSAGS
jgi:tetratricopeptide (TPR) repeat protein